MRLSLVGGLCDNQVCLGLAFLSPGLRLLDPLVFDYVSFSFYSLSLVLAWLVLYAHLFPSLFNSGLPYVLTRVGLLSRLMFSRNMIK